MSKILDVGIEAARVAGKFLWDNFGKVSQIKKKGDRDFATNLDREAEAMIISKIKARFPDHAILAEESGSSGQDKEYIWIIDPLDGTHNFIRNIDIFGVSIGLVHKQKDFVAGIIYMPKDDELYSAEKGQGAYKNGRKISVSANDVLKDCSIAFDSSIRYSPEQMLPALGNLAREVFNVRMLGSSARHLSYVAEGVLDFVVEFHDRPWDFAGGVCLIEEAGGSLTDLKGKPLTYKNIGYIASNKKIHQRVVEIVSACL
ncbi:MAG: inositol monophosphatase [Candidatus Omnitrophica bacterium]|nr:inositol monophosphatase [Candidatus Omnitrophota bacterium]MBU2044666.1 inositol monophosphatase [Candidatus Omnitrophota bacterium]MBU2265574.1 inositol monophosphatase [Candidatus Omnitrophota bacterium]